MTEIRQESSHVPLAPWEVGAELLDVLSRGLYSDAKDAIREYVQNGVDAKASLITLTVDGPTAVIRDDGTGMDSESIRNVRRFGASTKNPRDMVGYRGIGVYSAFGICDEMTIISRQSGMEDTVGWTFHFKEMRDILEADKQATQRQGIALADLLFQYTELISQPYGGNLEDHFTVVRLLGLEDEFRAQLNNAGDLRSYLLNTVPVAYPEEGYGPTINEWLAEHAKLNPVRILLRIGDELETIVAPSIVEDVSEPESAWITNSNGHNLAFIWYALSTTGRQIPSKSTSGFLMKMKGFTLGDREALKPNWPAVGSRTLYYHYTGEVHILDDADVYPNASRDGLEASRDKQILIRNLRDSFDRLGRQANLSRGMSRANRLLDGLDEITNNLKARQQSENEDQFEIQKEAHEYRRNLENAAAELDKYVPKRRLRSGFQLTPMQKNTVSELNGRIREASSAIRDVIRSSQSRIRRSEERASTPPPRLPRQVSLIRDAITVLTRNEQGLDEERVNESLRTLESSERLVNVPEAIAVLDNLKANLETLPTPLESIRRELRAILGWSPLAPVSLEEALLEVNVSLDTDRESLLIRAIDRGLIEGLGGRGEAYENVIRAIAEAVSDGFAD